ncbi:MAG TPA: lytic transglycosylase domain-containing protein [Acidobacteriota bacterium]
MKARGVFLQLRFKRLAGLGTILAFLAGTAAWGGVNADKRQKYGDIVRTAAEKHGLDEDLLHSIIQAESGYDPSAVSSKGAVGLMQLIPETAAKYGAQNIFDPTDNIEAGAHYLKDLMALYPNDLRSVLAAYNAGPDALKKHNGIPPYPETKRYIRKVLNFLDGPIAAGGKLYTFRDSQGRVLLTSDRFFNSVGSPLGEKR